MLKHRLLSAPLLSALLLLDQEFDLAALRAAQDILRRRRDEPHAVAILNAAYGLMGLTNLQEAYDFNADVVRDLVERRRSGTGPACHLDDEAQPLRSREKRPRGGCGGR